VLASSNSEIKKFEVILTRENDQYPNITASRMSGGGDKLAIASHHRDSVKKNLIEVFDVSAGKPVQTVEGEWRLISVLLFLSDKATLAGGGGDGYLTTWSLTKDTTVRRIRLCTHTISSVDVDAQGRAICGSLGKGERPNVFLLDLNNEKKRADFPGDSSAVYAVHFTPHGDGFVVIGGDGILRIYDAGSVWDK
jgi:WD40 repeat protein